MKITNIWYQIQWLKYYEKLYGGFETLVSEEEFDSR